MSRRMSWGRDAEQDRGRAERNAPDAGGEPFPLVVYPREPEVQWFDGVKFGEVAIHRTARRVSVAFATGSS